MFTCWRMSCPRGIPAMRPMKASRFLKDYLVKNDQAETDDHYIYQYLDLVDETNGRAWVTADRPVDVYWKLPKGL